MKGKKILLMGISMIITVLTACSLGGGKKTLEDLGDNQSVTTPIDEMVVEYEKDDYYFNWKDESHTTIDLSNGLNEITKSGIYEIKGTLKDGSLTVNVDKEVDSGTVYIVLNGVNISSDSTAPINIKESKKVVLLLEDGSENTIYQGSNVVVNESNEPSSAIFSKSDLTITGGGNLSVTSDFNDCITSKDDLKITDGNLSLKAKADGIVGKDLLGIEKANITIIAGKDGMRSTNETELDKGNLVISDGIFNIKSNNDGIYAYSLLQIDGGEFDVTTGGGCITKIDQNKGSGPLEKTDVNTSASLADKPKPENKVIETKIDTESKKALKANRAIVLNNGDFNISAYDDAIHSNGDVIITGGVLNMESSDDGIHSDTVVRIIDGTVNINNSYEGIEGQNITIEGGKINIVSSDDGFNVNDASGLLTLSSGEVYINAAGDGVDSNGEINMTGGTVYVDGPTDNGNGPIDYDKSFAITGGTIIAAGSSGMAQIPDSGDKPSILMYYNSTQSGGTITLKDSNGNIIESFKPGKSYESIAIASSKLIIGSTYTLYKDDAKVVTFELENLTTYIDESGVTTKKSGGPGGMKGPGGEGGHGGFGKEKLPPK